MMATFERWLPWIASAILMIGMVECLFRDYSYAGYYSLGVVGWMEVLRLRSQIAVHDE